MSPFFAMKSAQPHAVRMGCFPQLTVSPDSQHRISAAPPPAAEDCEWYHPHSSAKRIGDMQAPRAFVPTRLRATARLPYGIAHVQDERQEVRYAVHVAEDD